MKKGCTIKSCCLLLVFLFISSFLGAQENKIDTSNILIKFCTSQNKYPGKNIDIVSHVCIYQRNGDTTQKFSVKSFDLIYKNAKGEKVVITNNNPFFNFESKVALTEIKTIDEASNYYFTNVKIENIKTKQITLINRFTSLIEAYD